jgi:tagatose-1,6-bisphosphate aldolase
MLRSREPPTADLHAFLPGFVEGHDRSVAAVNPIEHLAHDLAMQDTRFIDLSAGVGTARPGRAGAIGAGTGTSGALARHRWAPPVGSGPLRSRV